MTRIRDEVDEEANVIFGSAIDETLNGTIRVSVVATGIDSQQTAAAAKGPRLATVGGAKPEPQPIPTPATSAKPAAAAMPAAATGGVAAVASQTTVPQLRQTSSLREVPAMEAPQPFFARPEPARQTAAQAAVSLPQPAFRPAAQPAERADAAARTESRLFAASARTQPVAPVAVPPTTATFTPYTPPSAGPSIFTRVTGALKRRSAGPEVPAARPEPLAYSSHHVDRPETLETPERDAEGDEVQNVPAFLRRQQSAP